MLVAGLLLLWLSSILLRGFMRANPALLAVRLRKVGGYLTLAFAFFMLIRGELNVAFGAAGFGLYLLGTGSGFFRNPFGAFGARSFSPGRSAPGISRVQTPTLEMALNQRTGDIIGRCLAGPFAGRSLASLSPAEAIGLHGWSLQADGEAARLLETYLDRRLPGWREAADDGNDAGRTGAGFGRQRTAGMPDSVAYQVLGLSEGASREEITRAHRRLMKQCHPDHGGSTEMAARVNEAKDVLMRRHP